MNKLLLFLTVFALGASGLAACSKAPLTVNEAIAEEFGKKYQKPVDRYVIETETDTGEFAKGSVRFKDELGGGLWFGAKTSKGWELAHDGQGPMTCEIATKYDFPKEMVPGCVDAQNGNTFVQR